MEFIIDDFLKRIEQKFGEKILNFFFFFKNIMRIGVFIQFCQDFTQSNKLPLNLEIDDPKIRQIKFKDVLILKIPQSIVNFRDLEIVYFENIREIQFPMEFTLLKIKALFFKNIDKVSFAKKMIFSELDNLNFDKIHQSELLIPITQKQFPKLQVLLYTNSELRKIDSNLFKLPIREIALLQNQIESFGENIKINKHIRYINLIQNKISLFPFDLTEYPKYKQKLALILNKNELQTLPIQSFDKIIMGFFDETWIDPEIRAKIMEDYNQDITSNSNFDDLMQEYYEDALAKDYSYTHNSLDFKCLYIMKKLDANYWIEEIERKVYDTDFEEDSEEFEELFNRFPYKDKYIQYFMDKFKQEKPIFDFFARFVSKMNIGDNQLQICK